MARHIGIAALLSLFLPAAPAQAQCAWTEQERLEPTGAAADEWFGSAVALSGNLAAVGAERDTGTVSGSGAAYVFRVPDQESKWVQVKELKPPGELTTGTAFGHTIAAFEEPVDGDLIVVGSPTDKAYVYRDTGGGFVLEAKLLGVGAGGTIASSVAVGDGVVVVGETGNPSVTGGVAVVHHYLGFGTWVELQQLVDPVPDPNARFGSGVAVDGDVIVVGDSGFKVGTTPEAGAVNVFRWDVSTSQYEFEQKLVASTPVQKSGFGRTIDISGDTIVVGAGDATSPGAAFVFEYDGGLWAETQKLQAGASSFHDGFGASVSIDGPVIGVGATEENAGGPGAAYFFRRSGAGWIEELGVTASAGGAGHRFGHSVSLSGETALVGANHEDGIGADSGAAYVCGLSFFGSPNEIYLGAGGAQDLTLCAGKAAAGSMFGVIGSAGGSYPGFQYAGVSIPLNPDPYFAITTGAITAGGAGLLTAPFGFLDAEGRGSLRFDVPPGFLPSLAGTTVSHAFAVLGTTSLIFHVSNPVWVDLAP